MERITATPETLMRQAGMTASEYMAAAIKEINAVFGEGYAKKNPQLVGQFMQTCALDYSAAVLAATLQDLTEVVSDLRNI